jgi:tetratricopeptide (TPR) repeat protein
MNEPQLPLFDWSTSIMGEGYRRLAAFEFDEAAKQFSEVRFAGQGDEEEITRALGACRFWQKKMVQLTEEPGAYPISKFYNEFRNFPFGLVPGLHQLKKALLEYITECLLAGDHYFIDGSDGGTVADLLMELRRYKKAEKSLLQWIEQKPANFHLRYSLAQVQWMNKQKGEAKKNYVRGLVLNPCRVLFHRILFDQLTELIEDVGAEMAPAYGWVRHLLPLISVPDDLSFCSESHRKAVDCYRLLWSANRALQKKDYDTCYRYRTELKAAAPVLYEEYFALLSGKE